MTIIRKILFSLCGLAALYPMGLHAVVDSRIADLDFLSAKQPSSTDSTNRASRMSSQEASTSWTLHDWISGTAEFGIGWRLDGIQYTGHVYGASLPHNWTIKDNPNLVQFNLLADATFFKYFYARTDLGYGVIVSNRTHFTLEQAGVYIPSGSYSEKNSSGFAWDWLVAGGFHIPVYKKMVTFEPEMGYLVKELSIKDSTTTRISAPFGGMRIFVNFCDNFGWSAFFDYLFEGVRRQGGNFVNTFAGASTRIPDITARGVRAAYQVGSSFQYMPWERWVFTLDWQLFHAQSKYKSTPYFVLKTLNENLSGWMSNQLEVMARYNF